MGGGWAVIVANPAVFTAKYVPPNIPRRDEELSKLKDAILSGKNVFLYGQPATGKTVMVSFLGRELKDRVRYAYVDCKYQQNPYAIMQTILQQWHGRNYLGLGYGMVFDYLVKTYGEKWVVFDDFPILSSYIPRSGQGRPFPLIESLAERSVRITLVTYLSNAYDDLNPSIKSRLNATRIVCRPYSEEDIFEILRDRAILGLSRDSWKSEQIAIIAEYVTRKNGNVRSAIAMLYDAAKRAEARELDVIGDEDIDAVLAEEPDEVYWLEVIAALPQHQQALVAAVAEAMEKTGEEYVVSGKVYSFYEKWCQKMGMRPLKYPVYSSELIPYLNISGIIEAEKVSMGRGRGVTRLLRLNRYISPSTVIRKALTDLVKQPVQLPP